MENNIIHSIEIRNVWGKYNFRWDNLNPDVNIVIGVNGSGKTTFFNIIDSIFSANVKQLKLYGVEVTVKVGDYTVEFNGKTSASELKRAFAGLKYQKISTFDVPLKDKRKLGKDDSPLYDELKDLVYEVGGENASFSDYRLNATNFPERAKCINDRIKKFYGTVNDLFAKTGKVIGIDPNSNRLVFDDQGETIQLHKLSSGEKQLLLILLKVFLMDEQPYILLMDEPEISLHIEWQYRLLEEIRKLNPNCQVITSTHSPSLFGDGWGNKLVFIEELIV